MKSAGPLNWKYVAVSKADTGKTVIKSFQSRILRRFYQGDVSRVQPNVAARVEKILSLMEEAKTQDELAALTGYHQLVGNRRGTYAVTVTRNHRVTFRTAIELVTDPDTGETREEFHVYDVDYEDYH